MVDNLQFAEETLASAFALAKQKLAVRRSDEVADADLNNVVELLSQEGQATQRLGVMTLQCLATASEIHVSEMVRLGVPARLLEIYKQTSPPTRDSDEHSHAAASARARAGDGAPRPSRP